jgi:hypothetical protein
MKVEVNPPPVLVVGVWALVMVAHVSTFAVLYGVAHIFGLVPEVWAPGVGALSVSVVTYALSKEFVRKTAQKVKLEEALTRACLKLEMETGEFHHEEDQ